MTYKFTNRDIDNITLQIAHIDKIAYGTFSNIYMADGKGGAKPAGLLGMISGYPGRGDVWTGRYYNLGMATVGEDTIGVTNVTIDFKTKSFKAKISNDYAYDLYNTLYIEVGANWTCLLSDSIKPFVTAQAIKQDSVGLELMKNVDISGNGRGDGKIDSLYWAAKFGIKASGLTVYGAFSQTNANDSADVKKNPYKNAILTQFGGMPAYTQGMVIRHQFLAGTDAIKFGGTYSFKNHGTNLSVATYYIAFDIDANSGYGVERTATEAGFDIKYYPVSIKNLQLRFRGNFPRKFAEATVGRDTGWDEYRLIVNYNF